MGLFGSICKLSELWVLWTYSICIANWGSPSNEKVEVLTTAAGLIANAVSPSYGSQAMGISASEWVFRKQLYKLCMRDSLVNYMEALWPQGETSSLYSRHTIA